MRRIVIVAYVPDDTDIFNLHEYVVEETEIVKSTDDLVVYESVEDFITDWESGSVA